MKFSMLLYGFHVLMRYTAWRYESFREHVKNLDFSMVIRTADGERSRRYHAADGTFFSRRGGDDGADFSLIWKDADSGFRYMMKMKPGALMHAIRDGSLKLEGDAGKVTRFLEMFKTMLACYR